MKKITTFPMMPEVPLVLKEAKVIQEQRKDEESS